EALVHNEHAFVFDPLPAEDVELLSVLRVGLICQSDVEEFTCFQSKSIDALRRAGGETWQGWRPRCLAIGCGALDAFGQLDGLDGLARLSAGRRRRGPEVRQYVMELRGFLHVKNERRQSQFLGNIV